MEFEIGTKIPKGPYDLAMEWACAHSAALVDHGEYYEIEAASAPQEPDVVAELQADVQAYLDEPARALMYDSCGSVCNYYNSTDAKFRAEARSFVPWRDKVWRKCYDVLAQCERGERAVPTAAELRALLPVLEIKYDEE